MRAAQSLGAAAALSVSSALLRAIYPARQLGRGLGINSVVVSSAAALAPTLGGVVLAFGRWPWVFAAAVPFALVSLLLGRHLPEPEPHTEDFDLLGAVLCAAHLRADHLGPRKRASTAIRRSSRRRSSRPASSIGFIFVRRELGEARPIMPVDLLARPVFALSTLGALTAFIASMTLILSMPFRLEHGYGFAPSAVGAMIAPWPLTTMFVAPAAGTLSDRVPAGLLGGIGMAIAVVALLLLAFLPVASRIISTSPGGCRCAAPASACSSRPMRG